MRDLHILIQGEACRACKKCLAARICKMHALMRMDLDEAPYVDIERCNDCRLCVSACPFGAISLDHFSPR